jgi:hypothetical protein
MGLIHDLAIAKEKGGSKACLKTYRHVLLEEKQEASHSGAAKQKHYRAK